MDMGVDHARGSDEPFAADDRRAGAHCDLDAVQGVRVARPSDGDDASLPDPD
jgi:hypothetical protein